MAKRRKRNGPLDTVIFLIALFFVGCKKVYEWLASFDTWILVSSGICIFLVCGIVWGYFDNKKEEKRRAFQKVLSTNDFSDNIEDYWVRQSNFKRQNRVEKRYRKKFLLHLLDIFNNQCANCGDRENGLDLDHFMVPKSSGGNFKLKHNEDGYWVNNAIPLCISCNRSKGNGDYKRFFSSERLVEILKKNNEMTKYVNDRMAKLPKKKRDAA